jgi:hypothetical protein
MSFLNSLRCNWDGHHYKRLPGTKPYDHHGRFRCKHCGQEMTIGRGDIVIGSHPKNNTCNRKWCRSE